MKQTHSAGDALDPDMVAAVNSAHSPTPIGMKFRLAGRPVVGRRVGALPETVVHGVTGLLVDDDRPESVAAALRALVAQPEQAAAMGRAGRERAQALFGPDAHAAQVERVYRRIVERRERWTTFVAPLVTGDEKVFVERVVRIMNFTCLARVRRLAPFAVIWAWTV